MAQIYVICNLSTRWRTLSIPAEGPGASSGSHNRRKATVKLYKNIQPVNRKSEFETAAAEKRFVIMSDQLKTRMTLGF